MNGWPLKELTRIYGFRIMDIESYGTVLFLATNRGKLAVKRTRLEPEELDLEFSVCEHLVKNGFDRLARIVPTQAGRGFAQVKDQRFLTTAWVDATQSNLFNPVELELATRNLAKFHRASRGYSGPVFWQKRRLYGVWPQRFSFRLGQMKTFRRQILSKGIRDEFDDLIISHFDGAISQAERAIRRLRTGAYYLLADRARKLGTICHHDYAYHNVLIDQNSRVWLVDFDYCVLDMPLHDLGSMILRMVKSSTWSMEYAQRILFEYQQEEPLEPGSTEALLSFMEYPMDFWQLAWAKYAEINMHKAENLLIRLKRLIDSFEARKAFLIKFAELTGSKYFLPGRDTL